jgi:hypothetical protein
VKINHPKGLKPKMRGRRLRSGVNWRGTIRQKEVKTNGRKAGCKLTWDIHFRCADWQQYEMRANNVLLQTIPLYLSTTIKYLIWQVLIKKATLVTYFNSVIRQSKPFWSVCLASCSLKQWVLLMHPLCHELKAGSVEIPERLNKNYPFVGSILITMNAQNQGNKVLNIQGDSKII